VDVNKRLIVTNEHVVGQQSSVDVVFPLYDKSEKVLTDWRKYEHEEVAHMRVR